MLDEATAGPSTSLRFGRDDNSYWLWDASAQEKLSSGPKRSEVEGPAVKSVPFWVKPNLDKSEVQTSLRDSDGGSHADYKARVFRQHGKLPECGYGDECFAKEPNH